MKIGVIGLGLIGGSILSMRIQISPLYPESIVPGALLIRSLEFLDIPLFGLT